MRDNPLLKIREMGQSIWLDYIRRGMIGSGELTQLIEEDGLRGVTSNPKIFDKVIAGSDDYDSAIAVLIRENKEIEDIYQALTVEDVRMAADTFRDLYDRSEESHGFVSLEVNPHLAYDTQGTIDEARRLWRALDRPNVFIKVPATREGLPAIRQLIAEGINVNVTLLFGLPRYREVAEAYIAGLEDRTANNLPIDKIRSVASFFLSRIDVLVDPKLEEMIDQGRAKAKIAERLHGQVAIASARQAYQIYKDIFQQPRFQRLEGKGAHSQRVLWASTSTKNPDYSDVKYVEALIGPETINTLPRETLDAYRDHGDPKERLEGELDKSRQAMAQLNEVGIDIAQVSAQLEKEGVEKFNKPYDSLIKTLKQKREKALQKKSDRQVFQPDFFAEAVNDRLEKLEQQKFCMRLWRKDTRLWSDEKEVQEEIKEALGWMHAPEKIENNIEELLLFAREIREAGFRHVVHMGMGGSSLAPLVFQSCFSPGDHGLPLTVLDTTDPGVISAIEGKISVQDTLFVVASKSGTTTEPLDFCAYFYGKVEAVKKETAGENFVAITDPGTPLVDLARRRRFRKIFLNFKDVGGRYSALTYFGLVPAALMGLDVEALLARALVMRHACDVCTSFRQNPGILLGAALCEMARCGRDKVTFVMPPRFSTLGMWLEQLLAESTGKAGTGLLPVAGEPLGDPSEYEADRVFAYFRLKEAPEAELEKGIEALRRAGQAVVTITLDDALDMAQEFLRWELATATAGAVMEINPFNQPNVQESKDNTKRLLQSLHEKGELPEDSPDLSEDPLRLYEMQGVSTLREALAQFLGHARAGDYVALLCYIPETEKTEQALAGMRRNIRKQLRLSTTSGYGPRYLHSTGQLHKGGPNTGLFLMLTADHATDMKVPGRAYTFGTLQRAQAIGDMQALKKHGRRVIRIHLGSQTEAGLKILAEALDSAMGEA